MKFAQPLSQLKHILPMLESSLTAVLVIFTLTFVMTVVHSGLLMIE